MFPLRVLSWRWERGGTVNGKRSFGTAGDLAEAPGHPFYLRLNELLGLAGFDEFCEARCRKFYHEKLGRPSLAPETYFRFPLVADRVHRGDRERTGHRVARSGFVVLEAVLADWTR